jgi:hypothetical protein
MADRLALLYYPARGIYLDPNEPGLGVTADILNELRYRPDGTRKPIKAGTLLCQRCIQIGRENTSVHLRDIGDGRLRPAHHGSADGPCTEPESEEHKAWKDRIATTLQRAGYTADVEYANRSRGIRTDVVAYGDDGRRIGWEVQLSAIAAATVTRRTNRAISAGLIPSWMTTDTSASSKTRPLVNRVPWSMATDITAAQIANGAASWVHGSIRTLRERRCKELPGLCPHSVRGAYTYDCGKWHVLWEQETLYVDDFVGKTAAGLYIPIAIPSVDATSVARWWVRPEDRDRYATPDRPCTEDALPEHLKVPRPRQSQGDPEDSRLHAPGRTPDKPRRATGRASAAEPVFNPVVPIDTLDAPTTADAITAASVLPAEVRLRADWFEIARDIPCRYYLGSQGRYCGATPTREFQNGRFCFDHEPHKVLKARGY